ncbi:MAG: helix-turn-helix domain-containing protein [Bacillota bacterium]
MEIHQYTESALMEPGSESHQTPECSIKHASPIHYHDFYEFFLITKGKTVHVVNGERQLLSEGTLVFIRPTDIHYYEFEENNDSRFINVCYARRVVCGVFKFLGSGFSPQRLLLPKLPSSVTLSPLEKDHLIHRLEKTQALSANDKSLRKTQLRGILVEVLLQFFGQLHDHEKNNMPLWLESLLVQMQKKECFTSGLGKMYELSGRSPGHLNRVFRQFLQTTPTEYINNLRLEYAKNLLSTTYLSVIDISMEAGFNNLSHFYHLFKKHFNTSPADFRSRKLF